MKLIKVLGATSEIWQVFIQDSSSTIGAGLTGLANNSSGLTAYFHRDTDTTATAISLASMTVGTFTSSGFKEIDATNMPGWYQFCPPNTSLASGAKSCAFHLKGATNMAPLAIEVQLTAVNADSANSFITGVNALAPPTNWNLESIDGNGRVDVIKINGTSQTAYDIGGKLGTPAGATVSADIAAIKTETAEIDAVTDQFVFTVANQVDANCLKIGGTTQTGRDIGASVLLSAGTGTGQLDFTSGVVKANLAQILGTALTETSGQIAAAFKQFFNIASPTSTMNVITTTTTATNVTTVNGLANNVITAASINSAALTAAKFSLSCTEPTAAVAASPDWLAALSWLLTTARNKITQTSTTQTLIADDNSTTIAASTVSDDGTTFTRGKFA